MFLQLISYIYHDHCCKGYFNKYHAKIEEIINNLEKEDSVTAGDDSFKARFLAIGLDFSSLAHSLTSIRDGLNAFSTEMVSNRAVNSLSLSCMETPSALLTQVTNTNPRWHFVPTVLLRLW